MLNLFNKSASVARKVFVVAEIGKNFIQTKEKRPRAEYLQNALTLIDAAADAGADAVKFQTHVALDEQANLPVVSPHFRGAERYAWIVRNERATPPSFWKRVAEHASRRGVLFFSTPMSCKAAEKLAAVNPQIWKVGSGDIHDFFLLDFLASTGKPIIISTGMASFDELERTVSFLRKRCAPFAILYCVSKYPAPPASFNLASICDLRERYPEVPIGFSDHSVGDQTLPLAAASLGARIIEKHFSLSRRLWGSDHKVSLTPAELKALVSAIRRGDAERVDPAPWYGARGKELAGADNEFRPFFFKTLVAARNLPAGATLRGADMYAHRPACLLTGIPSHEAYHLIGRKTIRPIRRFEPLAADALTTHV